MRRAQEALNKDRIARSLLTPLAKPIGQAFADITGRLCSSQISGRGGAKEQSRLLREQTNPDVRRHKMMLFSIAL